MAETNLTAIKGGRRSQKPAAAPQKPEPLAPARRKTLLQAIASGDELGVLEAMRVLAAKKLADPKTPARDFGTISKQLGEYNAQIAALTTKPDDDVDESGTKGSPDAGSAVDDSWDPTAI